MKLALMDFQLNAVDELLRLLKKAKREISDSDGDPQAVILSSPTGSGKTVITSDMMEKILEGSDQFAGEPDAVFLWLSDQPQLNEQSRKKIADTCSRFRPHDLIIIDFHFDRETFEGGKVYFLNIQKLGKDKKLTTNKGDMRQYTIWETIANTSRKLRGKFYLIVDEAHRGTQRITKKEASDQETILQKFVKGSVDIPPVDLILGMSATPQRFVKLLDSETKRYPRKCEISAEEVRESGLLKERIILFYPDASDPTDMTLLATAARRWKEIRDAWNVYIAEQEDKQLIHPAMVIQVEDGDKKKLTKTDLEQVLKTLEQEVGTISDHELAHSFQEDQTFTVGHHKIRKIEASRIQEETGIKFIFFKMALTTGWDCPRAEVMMSFRRAQDHTLIAQLIGRMIRTPLARRIEGRELLNTVSLYLPRFDKDGVNQVVARLRSDPDYVPPIDVEEGAKLVTFKQDVARKEAIDELSGLPTYRVEKIRKVSNTRRLMRLSRLLTMLHEIDLDAWDDSKKLIIETLDAEKERLRRDDPDFDKKVVECTEIKVNTVTIEQGTWRDLGGSSITVPRDDHNIDDLFNRAGQKLGEGLHDDYWQVHYDEDEPTRPKLELVFILQSQQAWDTLEKECGKRIEYLFSKHRAAIRTLTTAEREKYNKVKEIAKEPEALDMLPPAEIMVAVDKNSSDFNQFNKHLYIDEQGEYWTKLNTWEKAVIQAEIAKDEVVGWLRNYDRKHWALAMPYEMSGSVSPMYPDFLVVRKDGAGYLVDILEPHSPSLTDSYAKAQWLAKYARKHHDRFGRIELIRVDGGKIKRIDLNDTATRKNVLLVDSNQALELIFNQVNR